MELHIASYHLGMRKDRTPLAWAGPVCVLGAWWLGGCQCNRPDPPVFPCPDEQPVLEAPIADACLAGRRVFAMRLERSRGAPRTVSYPFSTAGGPACVLLRNASEGERRVSAARLTLDGSPLFSPSDLNQNVAEEVRRTELAPGEHLLEARVASSPGSYLEIEVRVAEPFEPELVASRSALARLRRDVCLEARLGASQLSPEELQLAQQAAIDFSYSPGQVVMHPTPWGTPSLIEPLPQALLAETEPGPRALEWMELHRDLFEVQDPDVTFRIGSTRPDGLGNDVVSIDQEWRGLPVRFGGAELRMQQEDGQPVLFGGRVVPARVLPNTADGISAAEAAVIARESLSPTSTPQEAVARVIYPYAGSSRNEAREAWEVALREGAELVRLAYVDAVDGSILDSSVVSLELEPRVRVQESTLVECIDGSDYPTATEVRYQTVTRPHDTDCDGDAGCDDVVRWVSAVDQRLFTMLRGSWSGGGADSWPAGGPPFFPEIPANAEYIVTYGLGGSSSRWVPTTGSSLLDRISQSRDTLAHETGHGVHQAQRNNWPILDSLQGLSESAIGEAMGDSLGLLVRAQDAPGSGNRLVDFAGQTIRDYSTEICTGYSTSDTCDYGQETGADGTCGPWTAARGCSEYTHMDFFADPRVEPVSAQDRLEPHLLGCALARPLAYALTPGERDVRGVRVRELPSNAAALGWRFVFSLIDRNTDTADKYGAFLRLAAAKLARLCFDNGSPRPNGCGDVPDPGPRMAAAIDASGFWSPAGDLVQAHAATPAFWNASTGVSLTALNILGRRALFVAFARSGQLVVGELPGAMPRDTDGDGVAEPYPDPRSLSGVRTNDDPAIVANELDGRVYIAVRAAPSGLLRVGTYNLVTGAFLEDSRFPRPAILGGPSLAATRDGAVHVAYRRADTGRLEVSAASGASFAAVLPVPDAQILERAPTLASDGSTVVLVTLFGPIGSFADPVNGAETVPTERAFYGFVSRTLGAGSFSPGRLLRRLPLRRGFGATPGPTQEAAGLPFFARVRLEPGAPPIAPSGPPAVAFYGRRVHVLVASDIGEADSGQFSFEHFSYEPDAGGGAAARSESRAVAVDLFGGVGRPGLLAFQDPELGDYLVAVATAIDARIGIRFRRSR